MPKRTYPFEVGVLRQFKTHINTFECDKAALRDIQNQTMERLFLAQKNVTPQTIRNNIVENACDSKRNFRQIQLSNYFPIKSSNAVHKNATKEMIAVRKETCSYCSYEGENISKCSKCLDEFCQPCSFPDYSSGGNENRICLSCM